MSGQPNERYFRPTAEQKNRAMKVIIQICRIIVGSLFIVSGLIKVNDAIGFSYKLEEYFSAKALGFPELLPYVLPISVFIVVGEVLLGVATLLGAWPKLTSSLILFMTLFFTWLTWYTWQCNPYEMMTFTNPDGTTFQDTPECVLTCGCFGDALVLTPFQSFLKDLFLLPFVLPFFLAAWMKRVQVNTLREDLVIGAVSLVLIGLAAIGIFDWTFPVIFTLIAMAAGVGAKVGSKGKVWIMGLAVLLVCLITQYYTLVHLPFKDYRAYAIGQNIPHNMKSAEELGLTPPKYMRYYTLKHNTSGELMEVDQDKYIALFKDSTFDIKAWEIQKERTRDVVLEEGYEPKIMDFLVLDMEGNDLRDSILALDRVFLLVMWNLSEAHPSGVEKAASFSKEVFDSGIPIYGFSTADYDQAETFRHEHQLMFPFLQGDEKVLKTMIRANPGLIYLEKGTVINMWSGHDIPEFSKANMKGFRP
jgi:uncharacterized membrane protein YphA (DoxX/SURF4 family)